MFVCWQSWPTTTTVYLLGKDRALNQWELEEIWQTQTCGYLTGSRLTDLPSSRKNVGAALEDFCADRYKLPLLLHPAATAASCSQSV